MQTDEPDLTCLEHFYRVAMPAAVRKLGAWQGLSPVRHGDVVADLAQDIAVDYVAHRGQLQAMSTDARHARWLRLLGRSHYRWRARAAHRLDVHADLDAIAAALAPRVAPNLSQADATFAESLLQHAVHLKNGRLNEYITARSIGLTPRQLRRRGARLVEALQGAREVDFWTRRLVEALCGLAADVLRDAHQVLILDEPRRPRPDPSARLRRVQAIRARLRFLPLAPEVRRVLARYGTRCTRPFDPELALASALELDPGSPLAHLWSFELWTTRRDARRAARSLREAHRGGADRVAVVLARARLFELRGRDHAARALLRRASARHTDRRLHACLDRLHATVPASG